MEDYDEEENEDDLEVSMRAVRPGCLCLASHDLLTPPHLPPQDFLAAFDGADDGDEDDYDEDDDEDDEDDEEDEAASAAGGAAAAASSRKGKAAVAGKKRGKPSGGAVVSRKRARVRVEYEREEEREPAARESSAW